MTTEREYQEGRQRIRQVREKSKRAPIWIIILTPLAFILLLGNSFTEKPTDRFQPGSGEEFEAWIN
ncbi:MAG: hypothetical protein QNJ54_13105 [Prochloraceae cyanobacterium]|nr:hypothetical protein [Prochloraceae cyanobacterium]